MKKAIFNEYQKLLRVRKKIQEKLEVSIINRGKEITIKGNPEDEFIALQILDALEMGFPIEIAMKITKEDVSFERLNIKNYTKRKNLEAIRGRIIGKDGAALRTMSEISDCAIELKDNKIGIIGNVENIRIAESAVVSLIQGSKHATVYSYLEKRRPEPVVDIGLKEEFKNSLKE